MATGSQACLLCDGTASASPLFTEHGLQAVTRFECQQCSVYDVPHTTDRDKLRALTPDQKAWLAKKAREQFKASPSDPFVINEGAILAAGHWTS